MRTVRKCKQVICGGPSRRSLSASAVILFAAWLAGCGAGPGGMRVRVAGAGEHEVPARAGYAYAVTKTFTGLDGKVTTAPSYRVFVASYDLDASGKGRTLAAAPKADGQVKLEFSLVGDEGGNDSTPIKPGDYQAKADKFRKAEAVSVSTVAGGKENKVAFDRNATTGEVKISSVSGDTVTGEVNLTSGDSSIKGPFTAKIIRL